MQTVVDWWKRWWLYLTLISALILIILVPRSVVNLIRTVRDWIKNWWTHLQPGDQGTWAGGIFTALTLIATLAISGISLIISARTSRREQKQSRELQAEEQEAAKRAHAEKFSCWVAGRIKVDDGDPQVQEGQLVVTLANASMQPFTEGRWRSN